MNIIRVLLLGGLLFSGTIVLGAEAPHTEDASVFSKPRMVFTGQLSIGRTTEPSYAFSGQGLNLSPNIQFNASLERHETEPKYTILTHSYYSTFGFLERGGMSLEKRIFVDYRFSESLKFGLVNSSFGFGPRVQHRLDRSKVLWTGIFYDRKKENSPITAGIALEWKFKEIEGF
jgi:hypothetical protein